VRAQIHHEIARLRDVTESLLSFSRTPRIERAPTDVIALVGHALEVLAEQIADGGVVVERELPAASLELPCDGYKLQGVLINLMKNAVEALTTRPLDLSSPDGSSRDPAATPERRLRVRARRLADGGGAVEVEDNGPGLSVAAREHLFEPFYTTKVTGTGLGLATAKRIVEAHGGTIELESAEGAGTRVRVTLPAAAEQPVPAMSGAAAGG
jgi:signal transduction histidine kinase